MLTGLSVLLTMVTPGEAVMSGQGDSLQDDKLMVDAVKEDTSVVEVVEMLVVMPTNVLEIKLDEKE